MTSHDHANRDSTADYTYTRRIPRDREYDLVVCGGGPAGTAAAIQAARQGARVLLLEAIGALGGMGTSALVSNWYCMANNEHSVIGGIMLEWVETLYQRGQLPPHVTPDRWLQSKAGTGFNAEGLKMLLDEMCNAAGVEIRFATRAVDVDIDPATRTIHGVILHNIEGHRYVPAKTVIDATGDAVVADLCGVQTIRAARDEPGVMPPTLCGLVANVDFSDWTYDQQQKMVEKAIDDGFFSQPDRHVPGLFQTGPTYGILNAGHIFHTDALDTRSLSDGYVKGRKLAHEYTQWLRQYLEGTKDACLVATAALMGVRESRRIIGEYLVDEDDYRNLRHFPDQVAIYCKQVDIHVFDCTPEEYERYYQAYTQRNIPPDGTYYGLPYGILVPKGWRNLWVAGRCVSADRAVQGAIRDQPACSMLGQAAGAAAVQHLHTQQPACDLNTRTLIQTLRDANANCPQDELAESMTRSLRP